jgi:peptidoglycan/xylan/chitin deacetylase (PgdA/CDA1 family)
VIRTAAKLALAAACHGSGALAALAAARRATLGPRVHLVGFHRVVDDLSALPPGVMPQLCTSTAGFARICSVAAARFEVLPLDEAAEALAGRRPLRRDAVCITFDDAYRDVFLRALPILRALRLPATVFVPTGFVDSSRPLPHDHLYALLEHARRGRVALAAAPVPLLLRLPLARAERLLYTGPGGALDALEALVGALPAPSVARLSGALEQLLGPPRSVLRGGARDEGALVMSSHQLRACVRAGVSLGAHTVDHVVLPNESPARVWRELERPRRDLQAISGRSCTAFAWCNGLYTRELKADLRACGYTVGVTTRDQPNRPGVDLLALGRKVIGDKHLRGPLGGLSTALAAAHLHDLYGALGISGAVDGERPSRPRRPARPQGEEEATWRLPT